MEEGLGIEGWGALLLGMIVQALRDCSGKGKRLSRPISPKIQQEAEAWLQDGQCAKIREALGYPWTIYTGDELVARAKSGEINWVAIGRLWNECTR